MSPLTYNYRIVMNDTRHAPWMGIYAVYYWNGKPIDHSVSSITPTGEQISDITEEMARMRGALDKPILKTSDFPPADDYRRKEWLETGNNQAEWQE